MITEDLSVLLDSLGVILQPISSRINSLKQSISSNFGISFSDLTSDLFIKKFSRIYKTLTIRFQTRLQISFRKR